MILKIKIVFKLINVYLEQMGWTDKEIVTLLNVLWEYYVINS